MGGDFNLITIANEKDEGNPIDTRLSNRFIDTINNYNLNNIGFSENIFIWAKQRNFIQVRLSIFLTSQKWMENFNFYYNHHLLRHASDHSPILLHFSTHNQNKYSYNNKRKKIKFEIFWRAKEKSKRTINQVWSQANT